MSSSTSPKKHPSRGEVWQVGLDSTKGREQKGNRPALIISVDKFNHGPAELVIAIPLTRTHRRIASHVLVPKGEAGLESDNYIMVEAVCSVSKARLLRYRGDLTYPRLEEVERILKVLLKL